MSKPQPRFQDFIKSISKTVNAYIKPAEKATYACIVLHEHLGLVGNIIDTTEFFIGTKISLMVPDLFLSVTQKTLLNNQFNGIKALPFSRVIETVQTCIDYLKKNHKKFILIGFSVGSAYGYKILQKMPNTFDCAFLFYGTPSLKNFDPNLVKTKTMSFYASDDKVKYLSDFNTYKQFIKKCQSNPLIKFERINGEGHGFANPDSPQFSERAVVNCRDKFKDYIPKQLLVYPSDKKDGCQIF